MLNVKKLMQTLDHVDTEKVTWSEFMNWLTKEEIIRNIANDQRLYAFSITRIEEEKTYIMKQMQVYHMVNINVKDGFNLFLVVYKNREVDLVKQRNLEQKVYSLKFISQYKKPKKLKEHPMHKQRKLRPFTANVNINLVSSRRLGVGRELNNNFTRNDRISLINELETQQQSSRQINIKMIDTQSLSKERSFNQTVDMSRMFYIEKKRCTEIKFQQKLKVAEFEYYESTQMTEKQMFSTEKQFRIIEFDLYFECLKIRDYVTIFQIKRRNPFVFRDNLEKPKQVRPYQILGLSDTTKDTDEVREFLRMKQDNQQNKKKRDQYFHTFGLDDRLFTPKNDQVKYERNFRGLIQGLEEILDNQDKQIKEIQLQKELRQSLLSLQLDESKRNLLTKFLTMKDGQSQKRFPMNLNQEHSQMRNSLQNKVLSKNLIGLRGKKSIVKSNKWAVLKSKISMRKHQVGSRNQGSLDKRNKSKVSTTQEKLLIPQQEVQMMKLEDLDLEELKKDLLQRKNEELYSKLKHMNLRVNHIKEFSQYFKIINPQANLMEQIFLHLYDLSIDEIARLKTIFPEFHKFVSKDGSTKGKYAGEYKEVFKMKLRETMPKMQLQMINNIVKKIDNVQTIYWKDFLRFLESEGELRIIINDMRISQPGTTRLLKEKVIRVTRKVEEKLIGKSDSAMKEGKNSIQFERLIFIDFMDMDYLVTVNDSKNIEIYDFEEMKSMYKFQFSSNYGKTGKKTIPQSSMINSSNTRIINTHQRHQSQVDQSSQSEYSSNIESLRKNPIRQNDYWKQEDVLQKRNMDKLAIKMSVEQVYLSANFFIYKQFLWILHKINNLIF